MLLNYPNKKPAIPLTALHAQLQAEHNGGSSAAEMIHSSSLHEKIRLAAESAVTSTIGFIANTVRQQLEGRVAAWGQEAMAACANVSAELASLRADISASNLADQAISQDAGARRLSRETAPDEDVRAELRNELAASLADMRRHSAQDLTALAERLSTLEIHKVFPALGLYKSPPPAFDIS